MSELAVRVKRTKSVWAEAKRTVGRLRQGIKTLADLETAINVLDGDINRALRGNRDISLVKVLGRARKMVMREYQALLEIAIEDQMMYLNRDTDKARYRYECRFLITPDNIIQITGYELLLQHGWYNASTNPGGVVKDHKFSVFAGYELGIDPRVIGHIANCEFLLARDNIKKSAACSITMEQLLEITQQR